MGMHAKRKRGSQEYTQEEQALPAGACEDEKEYGGKAKAAAEGAYRVHAVPSPQPPVPAAQQGKGRSA